MEPRRALPAFDTLIAVQPAGRGIDGFSGTRRFKRVMRLGAGAAGVVYEVIDRERGLRVALKTLPRQNPRGLLRLKDEFRTLRDLRHPNLVSLFELVEDEGHWFFTMELIDGWDFVSYVRPVQGGRRVLDVARLRAALGQLAAGLTFLHDAGTLHCDVKPSNVLVSTEGRVVLLDFGVAMDAALAARGESSGSGTPAYMAPEQARSEPLGTAADWYAVGVMLHEALSGVRPSGVPGWVDRPALDPAAGGYPRDLADLCEALLRNDPAARPSGSDVLSALDALDVARGAAARAAAPRSITRFVGRGPELAELAAAYESSREGHGVAVVLLGISGIGKSAAAHHFADGLAQREGALVLRGRCHERESVPFKAFDGVVDGLARWLAVQNEDEREGLVPPDTADLVRLFPALGILLEGVTPARRKEGLADDAKTRGFRALTELLVRVARARPLVVLLDDVHWADAESVALVEELVHAADTAPLLLLATARSTIDAPCPAVRALGASAHTLTLRGLGDDDARALVTAVRGSMPPPESTDLERLVAETEGHPLFLEELARHGAPGTASKGALDSTLVARARALDPSAQALLHLVAAAGEPTWQGALERAAGLSKEAFLRAEATLAGARFVRASGPGERDLVEPYHDRVREAVYNSMTPDELRAAHERVAHGLVALDAPPERLVDHFRLAGATAEAARRAELAAARTESVFAWERSATFLRTVLELEAPKGERRIKLLVRLGEALARAGQPRAAADAFLEAAAESASEARIDLERRAAQQLLQGGYLTEGLALTRRLLEATGLPYPETEGAIVARLLWHETALRFSRLDVAPKRAADVPPSVATRLDVFWSVGSGLVMIDTLRSSVYNLAGLRYALGRADALRLARALCAACFGHAAQGQAERASVFLALAKKAALAEGSALARFYVTIAECGYLFMVSLDTAACLERTREAMTLSSAIGAGSAWEGTVLEQFLCWCLWWRGEYPELRERLAVSLRAARQRGNRYLETALRTAFPWIHYFDDRPDQGLVDVREALAAWRPQGRRGFDSVAYWALLSETRGHLYVAAEDDDPELDAWWLRFQRDLVSRIKVFHVEGTYNLGCLALLRAMRARRRGDLTRAKKELALVRRLAATHARTGDVQRDVGGALLRAGVAAHEGRTEDTIAFLRVAEGGAIRLGSPLYHKAARHRLGLLLGGDQGRALVTEVEEWLRVRGVANPRRYLNVVVPEMGTAP